MDYGRIFIHDYPHDRADLDGVRATRAFGMDGFTAVSEIIRLTVEAKEMEKDTITLAEVSAKKAQLEAKIDDLLLNFTLETGLPIESIGHKVTHRVGEPATVGVHVGVQIP